MKEESNTTPEILPPQIVNAKPLVGALMRAITSVKWSPANRYVLMGFGVRSDGRVQDHSHSYVFFSFFKNFLKDLVVADTSFFVCNRSP
jgi:hypothetical protein